MALKYEVRDGKAAWGGRLLRDWVPDVVGLLVEKFDPAAIILFGSVAQGTDGPDSDLDFLVVLDDAPRQRRVRLMVELSKATRACTVPRDLLVTSAEDMSRRRNMVGTLEHEAVRDGVVFYERQAA